MSASTKGRGQNLVKQLIEEAAEATTSNIPYAIVLFGQAGVAFDGGTPLGTCILCRATLEAAYCFFLQRAKKREGGDGFLWSDTAQLLPGQKQFGDRVIIGQVVDRIRESGLLSNSQLAADVRVRKHGNWVVHMLSMTEKEHLDFADPIQWTTWIQEEQAWADLVDTADILRTVRQALYGA
jgi:hypothetical protein